MAAAAGSSDTNALRQAASLCMFPDQLKFAARAIPAPAQPTAADAAWAATLARLPAGGRAPSSSP